MDMSITRGVTPAQQLFIRGSTILAEDVSRLNTNFLKDPTDLRA